MTTPSGDLEAYLIRIALDRSFRDLAANNPDESFRDFELSEAHKAELRSPGPGMLALIGEALAHSGRFDTSIGTTLYAKAASEEDIATDVFRLRQMPPQTRLEAVFGLVKQYGYQPIEPSDKVRPQYDITIVGLGIKNIDHITREAEQAFESANEVLYVDNGVATHSFLASTCKQVTSLFADSYAEGRPRSEAYEYMAARTLCAAIEKPPIVFAIQGHPLIFCQPPFLIRNTASALGLTSQILPGISAIDTIACDIGIDPCTAGLQMYEATDLLLRERPLQPDVPALIWQVGSLESTLHTNRISGQARFERFQNYLLRFYPAHHPIVGIYSSTFAAMPPTKFLFQLDELCHHAAELHPGVTLFIPALKQREIVNTDLLEALADPTHLGRYTSSEG